MPNTEQGLQVKTEGSTSTFRSIFPPKGSNPVCEWVGPQIETTGVPTKDAICKLELSIVTIMSIFCIKASSLLNENFSAREWTFGFLLARSSNLAFSTSPPPNRKTIYPLSASSRISCSNLFSGHFLPSCLAKGAIPIQFLFLGKSNLSVKKVWGNSLSFIHGPLPKRTGKPAFLKTSLYLS